MGLKGKRRGSCLESDRLPPAQFLTAGLVSLLLSACLVGCARLIPNQILLPNESGEKGPDTGGVGLAAQIAILGGDGQSGFPNHLAESNLKVHVTDSDGKSVSGARVVWVATSGGGKLGGYTGGGTETSTTGSDGIAEMPLVLGDHLSGHVDTSDGNGQNSVTATLDGTSLSVTFTANSTVCEGSNLDPTRLGTQDGTINVVTDGEPTTPYYICNAEQLNLISSASSYMGKNFKLGRSIDLGGVNVNMIGDLSSVGRFTGTFNGNGYELRNLSLSASASTNNVALFRYTGDVAKILNVNISTLGVSAGASSNVAVLVAECLGGRFHLS